MEHFIEETALARERQGGPRGWVIFKSTSQRKFYRAKSQDVYKITGWAQGGPQLWPASKIIITPSSSVDPVGKQVTKQCAWNEKGPFFG